MPAQLIGVTESVRILVDKPILLVGRDSECDIQFDSRKISRRHCCIAQIADQLIVRDLGSTNGIRINGVRVLEGYLKAGDELAIGSHRYQVSWESVPAGKERDASLKVSQQPVQRPQSTEKTPTPGPQTSDKSQIESPLPMAESNLLDSPTPLLPLSAIESGQSDQSSKPFSFQIIPDDLELTPGTDDYPAISPRQREARKGQKPS